jgi:hypothetical protein
MTDLVIRPLSAGEEHLFDSLPDPGLVGFAAFGDTYSDTLRHKDNPRISITGSASSP